MRQIQVRAATGADGDGLRAFLTGLSPRSSFLRFCAGIGSPSARLLAALLRRDDRHGAWLAVVDDELVGHLMWSEVAVGVVEVGVVVADPWQRRGLARLLSDAGLREASDRGHTGVRLHVHGENRELLRRVSAGARSVRWEDGGVVVDRPLTDLLTPRRDLVLVA